MTTTAQETARRRLAAALRDAGVSDRPERLALPARYVASVAFRKARGARPVPAEARSVPVASTRELVEALHLRTYTDLAPFSIEPVPYVAWLPLQALVTQLVETIPTTQDAVRLAPEGSDSPAAKGGPTGTPLPEAGTGFASSAAVTPLPRFGTAWPVATELLDDEGLVQSMLEHRLRQNLMFGFENLILTGPTGSASGVGILNTPGVATVTMGDAGAGDVYRLDVVMRAVATVSNAGFYSAPLAAVGNPTTLRAIREEKSGTGLYVFDDELVPEIQAWVPSTQIPPGRVIVGDLFDAVALFLKDGLAVEMAEAHADLFTRGLVEMQLATRALCWVRNPTALCIAAGL